MKQVSDFSKESHRDVVCFQATAQFAIDLCFRSLDFTTQALDLGLRDSEQEQAKIISPPSDAFGLEKRIEFLHREEKREQFFRNWGRSQHLVAVTLLTYATLDTVLAEAVRLLSVHCKIPPPPQNSRGASIQNNLRQLARVIPLDCDIIDNDEQVFGDFVHVRNLLIHQGYFLNPNDNRFSKLQSSSYHGDYFEIREGFPILLREHGVRRFLEICRKWSDCLVEGIYSRILST